MAEAQLQLRALTAGEVLISQTTEAALLSLQALRNAALKGSASLHPPSQFPP